MGPCTLAEGEAEANGITSLHSAWKVSLATPITPASCAHGYPDSVITVASSSVGDDSLSGSASRQNIQEAFLERVIAKTVFSSPGVLL